MDQGPDSVEGEIRRAWHSEGPEERSSEARGSQDPDDTLEIIACEVFSEGEAEMSPSCSSLTKEIETYEETRGNLVSIAEEIDDLLDDKGGSRESSPKKGKKKRR
jgi:hypothetical protein